MLQALGGREEKQLEAKRQDLGFLEAANFVPPHFKSPSLPLKYLCCVVQGRKNRS